MFVRKDNSTEAWFIAELDGRYFSSQTLKILPSKYEIDDGVQGKHIIRAKKRFKWLTRGGNKEVNIQKLTDYHCRIRKDIVPIFAPTNTWYIRKELKSVENLEKSQLPLIFAAMHKLSELSRYNPMILAKHLENQHNWILTEFLKVAPAQFINNVACEITGKEFVRPFASRLE
jgi:hypothetical protein